MKAVYFFCRNRDLDPAAMHVFDVLLKLHAPTEAGITVDGEPVLRIGDDDGDEVLLVRTEDVLSHDYPRYLPVLNEHFADADVAGVVNWHEGANAPDRVLTVHSTGDVPAGVWGPTDPRLWRNLLRALEAERAQVGLEFAVVTEATHWSGVPYGGSVELIPQYPVPTFDIEIGSSPEAWADPVAHEVVAKALTRVFDGDDNPIPVLCAGGVHVETAWSSPVLEGPYAVAHHLPNQWLVSGEYDNESADAKLDACVASVRGGIGLIAYHDKLKATYKEPFRRLADRLGVDVVKHQALRRPAS